ncbi:XrtA/PEP-CTERM system TPR-repeat protein PrsT [Desulfuromonas sp. AOP6]|uniref:XrtA/PEP-CTERM system TPR-repeat protein PrsT n=1 Tax=Desulfuromonas sp. AOP6 TaxID=1566351 RepID=UPI00126F2DE1|nr:XrtA/PEP-CTERM system TPR-repeat protein PrsT [Desulfuromonas sp. AOP6]BCA79476.1 lipoprotein [Desulfuromonas sp. AOP6]
MKKALTGLLVMCCLLVACNRQTKESLYQEGLSLSAQGNYRGAVVLFKNALEKDPNYFEARFQLGNAYLETGKYERAFNEFEKVRLQNPSFPGLQHKLAQWHVRTKNPDEALRLMAVYLQGNEADTETLEIIGQARYQKKEWDAAEKALREAVALDDKNISAKLLLAQVLIRQQKDDKARDLLSLLVERKVHVRAAYYMLADLEAALGNSARSREIYQDWSLIDPEDADALFKIGLYDLDAGRFTLGEEVAARLIEVFPANEKGLLLKGMASYLQGQSEQASRELQLSIKKGSDPLAYYFLGLAFLQLEQYELALNQFHKVLDFNPDSVQARCMVAMTLLKQKRLEDAISQVQIALAKYPENGLAWNILGSAHMALGQYDKAMAEFNRAITLDPKLADVHLKKGLFNLSRGEMAQAEEEMVKAVRIAPDVLDTRLILANHYIRQQNYQKALEVLDEGVKGAPQDALIYNYQAGVLLAQKKIPDAISRLKAAKEASPLYFTPYFNLANLYLSQEKYDEALAELSAVLSLEPKQVNAHLASGMIRELQGNEVAALESYRRAKDTGTVEGAVGLANYHLKKGAQSEALAVLDQAQEEFADHSGLLELKSRLLLKSGRVDEARELLSRIEELAPGRGYPILVQVLMHYGKTEDAIRLAEKVIYAQPQSAYGYLLLASVHEHGLHSEKALQTLQRIPGEAASSPQVQVRIAQIFEKKQDYDQAMKTYQGILDKTPHFFPARFALGALADRQGNKGAALDHYRQVLREEPGYTPALNNLAYLYADNYADKAEALELALKAFRNAPEDPGILDTLGYVLIKNSRFEEAILHLEKAAALLPENPTVCYHLGLAYSAAGKTGQAVAILRKAKELGSFPEADKTDELLKRLAG